jgi:hypothetical protein
MTPRSQSIRTRGQTSSDGLQQALETVAQRAAEVDQKALISSEGVDALRSAGAPGWGVPPEYGDWRPKLSTIGYAARGNVPSIAASEALMDAGGGRPVWRTLTQERPLTQSSVMYATRTERPSCEPQTTGFT